MYSYDHEGGRKCISQNLDFDLVCDNTVHHLFVDREHESYLIHIDIDEKKEFYDYAEKLILLPYKPLCHYSIFTSMVSRQYTPCMGKFGWFEPINLRRDDPWRVQEVLQRRINNIVEFSKQFGIGELAVEDKLFVPYMPENYVEQYVVRPDKFLI